MPGLAAIFLPQYDESLSQCVRKMADAMCHEDFYKQDIFINEALPLVAARVHLNIINRVPQPVCNQDKTVFVMMDGELHNRHELQQRITSFAHATQNATDGELFLHLYEEYGEDFAGYLKGWFLAFIHDDNQKKTLVINDRYGIYRVYYAEHKTIFMIASEVKCLLKYKNLPYSVNEKSVSEFFAYDTILDDRTMFDQIHRLPPGSIWTYTNGTLRKKQYFDISKHAIDNRITKVDFLEEGNRIFKKIVPRYFSGDGIGISLTGGWDTRAILAARKMVSEATPCYTFSGMFRNSFDVKVARRVAEASRLPYSTVKLGKDFLDDFSHCAHKTIYISDGSADIFKSHEVYLNNIVKQSLPIRVTGKYGSQLLSGFSALKKRKLESRIFSEDFISVIQSVDQCVHIVDSSESMINEIRWLWGGYLSIETSQLVVRTPYTDEDLVEFLLQVPHDYFVNSDLQKYIITKNSPQLAKIPSDKGQYIAESTALEKLNQRIVYLLMKMDKVYNWHAMPHMLARLEPLWGRSWLQNIVLGHNQFINYRIWLKNELQDFAKEILLDESTLSRPYFDRKFLTKMVLNHFNGKTNYTNEIGAILSFEIWHRLFVD